MALLLVSLSVACHLFTCLSQQSWWKTTDASSLAYAFSCHMSFSCQISSKTLSWVNILHKSCVDFTKSTNCSIPYRSRNALKFSLLHVIDEDLNGENVLIYKYSERGPFQIIVRLTQACLNKFVPFFMTMTETTHTTTPTTSSSTSKTDIATTAATLTPSVIAGEGVTVGLEVTVVNTNNTLHS